MQSLAGPEGPPAHACDRHGPGWAGGCACLPVSAAPGRVPPIPARWLTPLDWRQAPCFGNRAAQGDRLLSPQPSHEAGSDVGVVGAGQRSFWSSMCFSLLLQPEWGQGPCIHRLGGGPDTVCQGLWPPPRGGLTKLFLPSSPRPLVQGKLLMEPGSPAGRSGCCGPGSVVAMDGDT